MTDEQYVQWFDNAYNGARFWEHGAPSPEEAQAMVDQALFNLGIDPADATDAAGWRHIEMGMIVGLINVIQLTPEEHDLVIWSPLLYFPTDARLQLQLFEMLLRLNHHETGLARFALQDNLVVLSVVRPIHALDLDEVLDAIRTVLVVADQVNEQLRQIFALPMPAVTLDDKTWQVAYDIFRLCDPHTQQIFKTLLEVWVARKGTVTSGKSALSLVGKTSGKPLAALIGYAAQGPLITIGWNSLEKQGVPVKSIANFKKAVPRPMNFSEAAGSAHLPVDESFTETVMNQLVAALMMLDKALKDAVPPPVEPLPNLKAKWGLDLNVGEATVHNIDTIFTVCPELVREIYTRLIQGWTAADCSIYTNNPNLVYLRLTVEGHTFALCTLRVPQKTHEARIELFYPLAYYFEDRTEARRRYEQEIAQISGFMVHNSGARIVVTESFTLKDADRLLKALLGLATDSRAGK